ncbi:hypothetical protein ARMSODRAFT_983447 [Armillaria solidipes]|uniref:Uncharacterized protein n=1 Tax=Armillaria solidipes TaxID=1076256 RepID=A0A2H3AQ91_9AGAR|nr:hypothetical protein ARMSODRAFT_983447 [Armillaria solidipes]
MDIILGFHSTVPMNIVAHNITISLYPKATFGLGINCAKFDDRHTAVTGRSKYTKCGWNLFLDSSAVADADLRDVERSLPHFAKLVREWLDNVAATREDASESFDDDLTVSLLSGSTNLNKKYFLPQALLLQIWLIDIFSGYVVILVFSTKDYCCCVARNLAHKKQGILLLMVVVAASVFALTSGESSEALMLESIYSILSSKKFWAWDDAVSHICLALERSTSGSWAGEFTALAKLDIRPYSSTQKFSYTCDEAWHSNALNHDNLGAVTATVPSSMNKTPSPIGVDTWRHSVNASFNEWAPNPPDTFQVELRVAEL